MMECEHDYTEWEFSEDESYYLRVCKLCGYEDLAFEDARCELCGKYTSLLADNGWCWDCIDEMQTDGDYCGIWEVK